MILDIRKEKEEITGIRFDDSPNTVRFNKLAIYFRESERQELDLCRLEDFDNFIAACHKAKELAGK